MTTSLSNITVKDGQNILVVKANDITINGSSILTTNNFVTLDTDQSITGAKTFKSSLYLTKDTPQIALKSTNMDITQSGWAKGRNTIAWCQDKNGPAALKLRNVYSWDIHPDQLTYNGLLYTTAFDKPVGYTRSGGAAGPSTSEVKSAFQSNTWIQ